MSSTISALPAAAALAGTEPLPTVQAATTVRTTVAAVAGIATATALQKASNLSDLANVATARTNLGLGTMALLNGSLGADTQVLFNDAGAMAGNAGLTFNKTSGKLTLLGSSWMSEGGANDQVYWALGTGLLSLNRASSAGAYEATLLEINIQTQGLTIIGGVAITAALTVGGPLRLKSYTVATLPAGTEGDTAYVTDASAPTYGAALTGGGTVRIPVFRNATGWVSA